MWFRRGEPDLNLHGKLDSKIPFGGNRERIRAIEVIGPLPCGSDGIVPVYGNPGWFVDVACSWVRSGASLGTMAVIVGSDTPALGCEDINMQPFNG